MRSCRTVRRRSATGDLARALALASLAASGGLLVGATEATAVIHEAPREDAAEAQENAPAPSVVIDMTEELTFEPLQVTVKVGDTVEWRTIGLVAHTVTANPDFVAEPGNVELPEGAEAFDSGWVRRGETFRYTFTKPGVYRYVCLPHENADMVGTIIVG